MIKNVHNLLRDIGLSENETAILIALFQKGRLKVSEIAHTAALNRTTIYGVLKSLINRGLVSSATRYGITEYESIDPSILPAYIDRQQEMLKQRKMDAEKLIPEIQMIRNTNDIMPSVSFFEGLEGVKQAYEDTLINNSKKVIYVFSGPDAVYKELGKSYIDYYVNKRKELGITCYQIASGTDISKSVQKDDRESLRFTKLISEKYSIDTEIVVYDDKLAFFSFSHGKLSAFIIEDEAISKSMKKIFDFVSLTRE